MPGWLSRRGRHNGTRSQRDRASPLILWPLPPAMATVRQVEDETYQLRPMNCPFHISVYKDGYYSYRDLPLRLAELGTVYRWVRAGGVAGTHHTRGELSALACHSVAGVLRGEGAGEGRGRAAPH